MFKFIKLNSEKGFSLIELMVVVAIIGILSAVAVPQFQKFQRKAKQSEAKSMLAAIYTAEKAFLAETGSYYENLWSIGYEPEGTPNYTMGFFGTAYNPNIPGYNTGVYVGTAYRNTHLVCDNSFSAGLAKNCMYKPLLPYGGLSTWSASATGFTVGASSPPVNGIGPNVDRWTINHRKELINVANGAL